jgi:hypothetical protein
MIIKCKQNVTPFEQIHICYHMWFQNLSDRLFASYNDSIILVHGLMTDADNICCQTWLRIGLGLCEY